MNVAPVLELLRQKIGLNPESIGVESIEKVVQEHMQMCGAANIHDYIRVINESPVQQKILIESVVVSETSFFRNKIPFATLQKYLRQFVLNIHPGRHLRILCVPCATGEEPYSIAMVLFNMKLPAKQFLIFAGDISEQALQIAQSGMYSAYSFRGEDIEFRKKYFTEKDGGYLIKPEVRAAVRFEQANILADDFLSGHKPYDIIFCRNLLIYFDDDTKGKAISALSAHLAEDGVLFVGHAEGAKIPLFGYASLDYTMSFAFARKKHAKAVNEALNNASPVQQAVAAPKPVLPAASKITPPLPARKAKPATERHGKEEKTVAPQEMHKDTGIADAKKRVEEGAFGEAVSICENLLARGIESAEVYYLLGQAVGETGNNLLAEEYLKKAIYLNTDFDDALMYLAVIFDRIGNHEKAAAFRRRAERVHQRTAGK